MPKCRLTDNGAVIFQCPGCDLLHAVYVTDPSHTGQQWRWNQDTERPTFNPSVLVRWNITGTARLDKVCHSFVRDGKIQFLADCTHSAAGKTLPLPDLDE